MVILKTKGGPSHPPYPEKEKGLDATHYLYVDSGVGFDSS